MRRHLMVLLVKNIVGHCRVMCNVYAQRRVGALVIIVGSQYKRCSTCHHKKNLGIERCLLDGYQVEFG